MSHQLTGVVDGSVHCLRCKWSGWPDEVPDRCGTAAQERLRLATQDYQYALRIRDKAQADVVSACALYESALNECEAEAYQQEQADAYNDWKAQQL